MENIAVLLAVTGDDFACGQQHVKAANVIADGTLLPAVFAMHVHAGTAADGGHHCACHNGRPPAVFQNVLPQGGKGYARFKSDEAVFGIPVEYAIHAAHVEQDVFVVHGGIAVAVATAA